MSTASLLLIALVALLQHQSSQALEKTWGLYHSLNGGQDFSRRATVVLSVGDEEGNSDNNVVELTVNNDNSTLNDDTFSAAQQPGAMYQLKLVEGNNDPSSNFLLTSVPACQLLRANFREEMVVTFGPHASAISLTYIPLVSPLAPKSCNHESWEQKRSNLPEGWETRISFEVSTPGMVLKTVMPNYKPPPGLKWLPRVGANGKLYQANAPPGTGEKGGAGGGAGEQEMPQGPMGFIKRYWYILLPLIITQFMSAQPPEAEGQPAGGEAQAGGGGGTATPAASPSGGNPPRSKRGKKG